MLETLPLRLDDGWSVGNPLAAGLDVDVLENVTRILRKGYEYPNVHAVLIERAGNLVYELYLAGQDGGYGDRNFNLNSLHDLRSISKSVTSLLLGIALQGDYERALSTPLIDYFQHRKIQFSKGARDINLFHALTMTAGFEWDQWSLPYSDRRNDARQLAKAEDPVQMLFDRKQQYTPGKVWVYNGGLTQLLVPIIEQKTGKTFREFATEALFAPLGISNFEWFGSWDWKPVGQPSSAWGLRMRARDLAKIGSLMLYDGVWAGRQIVNSQWIQLSGQQHIKEAPLGNRNFGYGFQWWSGVPGAIPPYRVIGGFGLGGQRLLIVPEHQLVVTVFAGNYDGYQQDMGNRILGHIMGSLNNPT